MRGRGEENGATGTSRDARLGCFIRLPLLLFQAMGVNQSADQQLFRTADAVGSATQDAEVRHMLQNGARPDMFRNEVAWKRHTMKTTKT